MSSISALTILSAQNIADLPHYNTNIHKELPADHAPMGVLADGGIYSEPYFMLTPSDISFLKKVTGRSFDPETIRAEQTAGTFRPDALAEAIAYDRVDAVYNRFLWGNIQGVGLSGDITSDYLQSMQKTLSDSLSGGMYQGHQIAWSELTTALSLFDDKKQSDSGSESKVNVKA